ncbi:MAG: 16S rRNA (uracil(1498)-N(3))-methyltransferase [Alphaproteobacteria bacterium]|jgi:16S rRNA (uracil1498-N3)-methyltransferase|nr:16S rRNA (uracil(1498)-N(3))-methyltransferase [Alphaproteobacteria bacterium]MDP6517023.1 16S rRNA (uracil(1498)-N(3))-methyltransferase [Alphaproteobacteria bacterium]
MTDRQPGAPRTRLFVDAPLAAGMSVPIRPDQDHYLRRVLRLGDGDTAGLFNGRDGEWRARIDGGGHRQALLTIESHLRPQSDGPDIWLLFAPIKRGPIDVLARKATELGAARLQPVMTRHTAVTRVNIARLRANAIEAAEQCGRLTVPDIRDAATLDALCATWPRTRTLYWADETGAGRPVGNAFSPGPAAILTGPEGGFAAEERAALAARDGVVAIDLGPRILRADTAALAALALWQALAGDWPRAGHGSDPK